MSDGLHHGETGGLKNVDGINDVRVHDPHADVPGHAQELRIQLFPLLYAQKFAIPQPLQTAPARQHDSRGHDGTGQRPAAGLIHPGHAPIPACSRFRLEGVVGLYRHELALKRRL